MNAVYYKGVMERLLNRIWCVRPGMCESGDRFLLHNNAPSHHATIVKLLLAQRKVTVLGPPSVFTRFGACWSLFVPKSEIALEGAPLWLDFGHPGSRDKYTECHCKGWLLQRHQEAVWPCRSVYTVTRDLCRKLNNKSVISFIQILFLMPVIKLSRCTAYASIFQGCTPCVKHELTASNPNSCNC